MDLLTSLQALAGGVLIGLGVATLLLLNGRVFNVSGMIGSIVRGNLRGAGPHMALVGGVILSPILCSAAGIQVPQIEISGSMAVLAIGGLLVGLGSRLGRGSCSGHAVCGVARFSLRSAVAVSLFVATAMLVVFVIRHVLGAGI